MKTVAVISHLWLGHIPAYHRVFLERILASGHRAISLAPVGEIEAVPPSAALFHAPFGRTPAAQLDEAQAAGFRPLWRRWLDRSGGSSLLRRTGAPEMIRVARRWRRTARALAAQEGLAGARADLAILVYPSSGYLASGLAPAWIPRLFPRPWAGVWNGPDPLAVGGLPHGRSDGVFRAANCRAVLLPDPWLCERLRVLRPDLPVRAMPEIADLRPPQADHPQVLELRWAAGARRIVGLLGNITLRKGILTFVEMAALAWTRGEPLFFMAAGDFSLNSCGGEFEAIAAACREAPPNFRLFPRTLADGPEFNAHVAACDALFAAYLDFPFQSNLITKAAAFAKPIVVSRGHLMEWRTAEFGLGLAVPQGDAPQALAALSELLAGVNRAAPAPRYTDYLRANGAEELDRVLADLLAVSPAAPPRSHGLLVK